MDYSRKQPGDEVLPGCQLPDICYKQWCQEVNRYLGLADSADLSELPRFQRALKRKLIDTTQQLIDDFKGLDPYSCAYLTQNLVPVMRNLSAVRQHADAELKERLSAFESIVREGYEKHRGASVEDVISSYDSMGSSLRIQ